MKMFVDMWHQTGKVVVVDQLIPWMHVVVEADGARLRKDSKYDPSEEAQDPQAPVDDDAVVERQEDKNVSAVVVVKMEVVVEDPSVDWSLLCHYYHFQNYCYRHLYCFVNYL